MLGKRESPGTVMAAPGQPTTWLEQSWVNQIVDLTDQPILTTRSGINAGN